MKNAKYKVGDKCCRVGEEKIRTVKTVSILLKNGESEFYYYFGNGAYAFESEIMNKKKENKVKNFIEEVKQSCFAKNKLAEKLIKVRGDDWALTHGRYYEILCQKATYRKNPAFIVGENNTHFSKFLVFNTYDQAKKFAFDEKNKDLLLKYFMVFTQE